MIKTYGDLSGLLLLRRYLDQLKDLEKPLCHQLLQLLQMLLERQGTEPEWRSLADGLAQVLETDAATNATVSGAKSLRLWQKAVQAWRNRSYDDQAPFWVSLPRL